MPQHFLVQYNSHLVEATMEHLVAKLAIMNNKLCRPSFGSNSQHITFQQDFAVQSASRQQ
jgi:hypothetical protein